jgi:hypothetical protein
MEQSGLEKSEQFARAYLIRRSIDYQKLQVSHPRSRCSRDLSPDLDKERCWKETFLILGDERRLSLGKGEVLLTHGERRPLGRVISNTVWSALDDFVNGSI